MGLISAKFKPSKKTILNVYQTNHPLSELRFLRRTLSQQYSH
ncbi:hypothetical protein SPLC1_S531650 [Arthrospira platensis C1]|nr:hypothetical protein SPLC1_S531650 [Arthrospira platensis C1]